jgi:hypothetical protein
MMRECGEMYGIVGWVGKEEQRKGRCGGNGVGLLESDEGVWDWEMDGGWVEGKEEQTKGMEGHVEERCGKWMWRMLESDEGVWRKVWDWGMDGGRARKGKFMKTLCTCKN